MSETDRLSLRTRALEIERDGSMFFAVSVSPGDDGTMKMHWYGDLTVVTNYDGMMGTVDLFKCRDCASLTDDPPKHIAWHQARS